MNFSCDDPQKCISILLFNDSHSIIFLRIATSILNE